MLSRQDEQGRWKLEYSYHGKMWMDVEKKGKPSKWVTLRALRVLKRLGVELQQPHLRCSATLARDGPAQRTRTAGLKMA